MRDLRTTKRDEAILRDAWLLRYVTAQHIQRLHFTHIKPTQRRLKQLTEHRYLSRFQPERAAQTGFRTWWYKLAKKGAQHVAKNQRLEPREVMPPTRSPKSPAHLEHHSLITDFRIWLREACQATQGRFSYEYIPNYQETRDRGLRRRRIALTPPNQNQLLIPDGAFTLIHDGKAALFLLEADQGTEPLTGKHRSAIHRKLDAYAAVYDAQGEDAYQHIFQNEYTGFRILCLVPDKARQEAFLRIAEHTDLTPLV